MNKSKIIFYLISILWILHSISMAQINGVQTKSYPRTMSFGVGGPGSAAYEAQFDLSIIMTLNCAYYGSPPLTTGANNAAIAIKALKPLEYVMATNDWNAGAMFRQQLGLSTPGPVEWAAQTTGGAYITYTDGGHYADPTDLCSRYSGTLVEYGTTSFPVGTAAGLAQGETFSEALARCWVQYYPSTIFDGYFSDGTYFTLPGSNRTSAQWAAGWNRTAQDIRKRWGANSRLLGFNTMTNDTTGTHWYNGAIWEGAPDWNGPISFNGTNGVLPLVNIWNNTPGPTPRIIPWQFSGLYDRTWVGRVKDHFRQLRWGLGTALLVGNVYFGYGEGATGRTQYIDFFDYYDEYDAQLGLPVGTTPIQIGSTGVWVRFYDNGCVIVNESQTAQTVNSMTVKGLSGYAGPYYRFRGNQDLTWNDGSVFSSVTLNSTNPSNRAWYIGDALILLKAPSTVVAPIIVDNAYAGTSPGSPQCTFVGTWTAEYPTTSYYLSALHSANLTWQNWAASGGGAATATYTPTINVSGKYKIYEWHGAHAGAATNAPCYIYHAGGIDSTHFINQSVNTGKWNVVGTYNFNSGGNNKIVITNKANGSVVADAYKCEYVPDTGTAVPAAPNPLSPPRGSLNQPTTLILTWNKVNSATTYHFQISADSLFSGVKYPWDSTLADTNVQLSGLNAGQKYFWHVSARNYNGTSAYSDLYNFSTTSPTTPSVPSLVYPSNGTTGQPITLTLSWNVSAGAAQYHLQAGTDSLFNTLIVNDSTLSSTSRQLSGLGNGKMYFWRVRAKNGVGTSSWSAVWNFTTIIAPPAIPVLLLPSKGTTGQPIILTLRWNASAGAAQYHLQAGTDSLFNTLIVNDSTLSSTSRQFSGLENGKMYFWRVRAKNSVGTSSWSAVWNFTTLIAPPAIPVLLSPSNGATNQPTTLTLSWSSVSGAVTYHIQVAADSNFTSLVINDSTITSTSRQLSSLINNMTYYWRVSAGNSGGISPFSSFRKFSTKDASAVLTISRSSINFGKVEIFSSKTDSLTLTNNGTTVLTITNHISPANIYSSSLITAQLRPQDQKKVYVTFTPNRRKLFNGMLFTAADSTGIVDTVILNGQGVYHSQTILNLKSISFPLVPYGAAIKDSFVLHNVGELNLSITNVHSNNPIFTISPINAIILPNDNFAFQITANPVDGLPLNGYVMITGNDGNATDSIYVQINSTTRLGNPANAFSLAQNYPNPFNPSTLIKYTIGEPQRVILGIYNILGIELARLVDQEQKEGQYDVIWDASKYPSGTYYYRLQAGDFLATHKLILIK